MQRVGLKYQTLILAAVSVTLCGCRAYHMYDGNRLPDAEVGTVTQTYAARMMTVDGGDTGVSSMFKLLPGEHAIEVEVYRTGKDVEIDKRIGGSTNRMQGEFRWYACACTLHLNVVAGQAYEIDGGEVAPGKWNVWAAKPNIHPEHSWATVEKLDPPRCTCETNAKIGG